MRPRASVAEPLEFIEKERHTLVIDPSAVDLVLKQCAFTLAPNDPVFVPTRTSTVTIYFFTAKRAVSSEEVMRAISRKRLRAATVIEALLYLIQEKPWRFPPVVALGSLRHHDISNIHNREKTCYPVIDATYPVLDDIFSEGATGCPVRSYPLTFRWARFDKNGELVYWFAAVSSRH